MRPIALIIALLFAVSVAEPPNEKPKDFTKHCKNMRRRECNSRGRRCDKLLEPMKEAPFATDYFIFCAVKGAIPEERRSFFMEALAIAFRDGGSYIIEKMTPEDKEVFFKYQHCVFTFDGLINQDGSPNFLELRSRLEAGVKEHVESPTPEFEEELINALQACPAELLYKNLGDCVLGPCIRNIDATKSNPRSPNA